jgi:hypothetical protein
MSKIGSQSCFTGTSAKRQVCISLKRVSGLLVLALLLGAWPAWAADPDDQYLQIYSLIQQADDLNTSGKAVPALAKYQEAETNLVNLQKSYPGWNAKLVSYRLNYVAQKVAALTQKPAEPAGGITATNTSEAQPKATAATPSSTTQVKLLEAGAEPRKVLRLHPKAGDKQTLGLTMKMAMETKVGEMEGQAVKMPAMKLTMAVTVNGVSDNGEIAYEIVMGDASVSDEPGVMPQVAEAMKAAFAGVKGMSATATMSSRGLSHGIEFKAPAGSDPQARQLMDQLKDSLSQLTTPLPEEAIGLGAKWEVKTPIKSQGMTMDQTTVSELASLEGDRLTTKNTISQHAANQKVQNPAMPGLKMDLTKMAGKGTGERTIDLGKLLPIAGTGEVRSETSMSLDAGGQKQAMTMKMDMNVRLEAK